MTCADTNAEKNTRAVAFNGRLHLRVSYQCLEGTYLLVGEAPQNLEDARSIVIVIPVQTSQQPLVPQEVVLSASLVGKLSPVGFGEVLNDCFLDGDDNLANIVGIVEKVDERHF